MVTSANIRAGGASVEIVADSRKLDTGLREAEAKLRAYNQRVRQLNKEATAAAKAGDQGQAIRLGVTARELEKRSQRVTERTSTLSQRDDARGAMAQRLASFKAGKAALLSDQSDLEERLATATMKPRDLALRDLDRHFAQMRSKYVGNATMLQRIEQTAAAERAKVNSDYSTGIIGGLGGKRLAKQEMRYAAASLAGVAGGEVGMVAMTLLSGAGMAAAVVAPLLVLGVAFKGAVEADSSYNLLVTKKSELRSRSRTPSRLHFSAPPSRHRPSPPCGYLIGRGRHASVDAGCTAHAAKTSPPWPSGCRALHSRSASASPRGPSLVCRQF